VNEEVLRRISARLGPETIDAIAGLSGADITTLMMEIARRRADEVDAAEVLRRYRSDRFSRPTGFDPDALDRAERLLAGALPTGFDEVALAPVVPLGTHRLAGVDQSRVVSTVRANEVAADPTTGLTLEAAVRRAAVLRADARSPEVVRLAASQRVLRAQRFEGAATFSHFQLFGLVSAGRDTGDLGFEREAFGEHIAFVCAVLLRLAVSAIEVELTDLTGDTMEPVAVSVRDVVGGIPGATVLDRPEREAGRAYYDRMCFKVYATAGAERLEIADGGLVDWTQQLLQSRKERLMIRGLGVERIALLAGAGTT
jgi:hypothetical protein